MNGYHRIFAVLLLWIFIVVASPLLASAAPTAARDDYQQLTGRWVRPDGGYVLELREVGSNGSLKATYANPRPINVSRAEWSRSEQGLGVFVELRDVNYPGSTYTLSYEPATDRLAGTYFQALQRQSYAIEFVRDRK